MGLIKTSLSLAYKEQSTIEPKIPTAADIEELQPVALTPSETTDVTMIPEQDISSVEADPASGQDIHKAASMEPHVLDVESVNAESDIKVSCH